jgi:hypothetical protein
MYDQGQTAFLLGRLAQIVQSRNADADVDAEVAAAVPGLLKKEAFDPAIPWAAEVGPGQLLVAERLNQRRQNPRSGSRETPIVPTN